jgi:hypothetical protein
MQINEIISASLDAGDYGNAALAIMAHPRSRELKRETLQRLYDFGVHGVVCDRVDEAMIEALGDLMVLEIAP